MICFIIIHAFLKYIHVTGIGNDQCKICCFQILYASETIQHQVEKEKKIKIKVMTIIKY